MPLLKYKTQFFKTYQNYSNLIYYSLYSLLFIYLYVLQLYYAWNFTVDDAFISLRYAKHLATGHGLSWNIGAAKVEGYSNFLYVVIEALFFKLKLPVIISIKLFSIAAIFTSCVGLYLISRQWLSHLFSLLAPLILLMLPGEILWGISGLETPFYQALIIFSIYCLLKNFRFSAGILIAIAGLTRPEAPMLFLVFLTLQCLQLSKLSLSASSLKKLGYFIVGFGLIYTPYFLWRIAYFGKLFPNPVYCKALNAPASPFELDISYLILITPFLLTSLPYLINRWRFRNLYLLLPSLAYLIALINADWIVGFYHRHFLAAYALLLPLFICGIKHILQNKALGLTKPSQKIAIIAYALIGGYLFSHGGFNLNHFNRVAQSSVSGNLLRTEVGKWLKAHIPQNHHVSLGDCGLIPYLYDGNIIDSYCLNSIEFTKPPIDYSYQRFANWLLDTKKPEVIILLALIADDKEYYPPADYLLLHHKKFNNDYHVTKKAFIVQPNRSQKNHGYKYEIYSRWRTSRV